MQAIIAALQLSIVNASEPIATLLWGIALVLLSSRLRARRVDAAPQQAADDGQAPVPGRFSAAPARLARTFTSL